MRQHLFAGLVGSLLVACPANAAEPIAKVGGGTIGGSSQSGLNIFLGVPYAEPPVGDLRWREPQPVRLWSGVRAATRFAPSCQQDEAKPFGPYTAAFLIAGERSEDCLYLNVWAPVNAKATRPVYVFIHGGGFQGGGADVAAYDGAGLARKGAVVVTINYRLGVFGFFAHPELTRASPLGVSGNQGILDAIESLRWVRANITQFGGDPANVTIAGQSAGAGIVNALLVSPLAQGLFHRAVLQSGPELGIPIMPLAFAEGAGSASMAKARVDDLAGLRAIPAAEFVKRAGAGFPLPIIDGKILPISPEDRAARLATKVPIMIGYNRDEAPAAQGPQTIAAFKLEVAKRYAAVADRLLSLYPHATDAEAVRSSARLARDRRIAGLLLWAERRSSEGVPVYAYHFEQVLRGTDPAQFGAFHTAEVPYIFGALHFADATFDAADRKISDAIQNRWLSFMRSGNPGHARSRPKWQRAILDPASIWRIAPADAEPLLDADKLSVFREFEAKGGKLSLL
jgi:para-nitrobenzyl esterase